MLDAEEQDPAEGAGLVDGVHAEVAPVPVEAPVVSGRAPGRGADPGSTVCVSWELTVSEVPEVSEISEVSETSEGWAVGSPAGCVAARPEAGG